MRISPAGTVRPALNSRQDGFTLVEVLMTLLIVGLMTGLVVLNLPEEPDPIEKQGQLLAKRLKMASQTSMIENHPIGIELTRDGYSVVRFVGDEWETIEEFEFTMETRPVVELVQNGAKIDLEKALEAELPVIRYDATGLATPFELSLDIAGQEMRFVGGADGSVLFNPEDDS